MQFFEASLFTMHVYRYINDDEFKELQSFLIATPTAGDLMPDTGGFRKLRWSDSRRKKGKRGGLRVIYYYLTMDRQIWLFSIYDKDEMADLTKRERKILKEAIEAELNARSKKRK